MFSKSDFLKLYDTKGIGHIQKVLTKEFENHLDPVLARKQHWWLRLRFPSDSKVVTLYLRNCLRLGFFNEALEQLNKLIGWRYYSDAFLIKSLILINRELKRQVVNSKHVDRLYWAFFVNANPLTKFGRDNYKEVLNEVDAIIIEDYSEGLLELFCSINHNGKLTSSGKNDFNLTHFELKGNHLKKLALACANIIREAENRVRIKMGGKKIGEGYVRETELFYKLKTHFSDLKVVHHGKPKFLGRQHLDIWMPSVKIGVEYQGLQHDQPVDFFGGQEAFEANQIRDQLKKEKCKKNGVHLIEVRPDYELNDVITKITKIIENSVKR